MQRAKSTFNEIPVGFQEVYLQPGEWFWGVEKFRIKTLLGSCVALCVWHPTIKAGGMTHCLLPTRGLFEKPQHEIERMPLSGLSGRYVDEVLEIFFREMRANGTQPRDYIVKAFGGGNMFEFQDATGMTVGERNIDMMRRVLSRAKMPLAAEHMGGKGHRHIIFELWNGDCWMRHEELP